MRKILLILLIGFIISPLTTYAGIYGILKGKVVDSEGKAVIGASIFIEGTTRGTYVKDKDGGFTIVNINTGKFTVRVRAIGYAEYKEQVTFSADQTTEINVVLQSEAIKMKEVVISGEKEMVTKSQQGSMTKISGESIKTIAREGIQGIVGLSAGVITQNQGFNIRGSRTTETQIRVDGLDVGDQFQGGTGSGGVNYTPIVSAFAIEEVQVITGNFAPEYGEALGGVVNSTVKTGRIDRYEGYIRWRTDVDALWGSQKSGLDIVKEGEQYKIINTGPGKKALGPNQNKFEFGTGGPLPILENSTFYLSGYYLNETNRQASYEIYDPAGNNIGFRPDNGTWVKNITGRLRFAITQDISLIFGTSYGITSWENSGWDWLYVNNKGMFFNTRDDGSIDTVYNNMPERVAKQGVGNQLTANYYVRINHTINDKTFYEFTISNTSNNTSFARRQNYDSPNFFTGFQFMEPQDSYRIDVTGFAAGTDHTIDWYQPLIVNKKTADGYFTLPISSINPLTGYIEGSDNYSGTNNPYGLNLNIGGLPLTHGNDGFEIRRGNYWQFDGSFTHLIDGEEFDHTFKTGFEVRLYNMKRHQNGLPWDQNPFYDVYTDDWGGNFYAEDSVQKEKTSQGKQPYRASLYLQDQISFKQLLISPGLRFDYFNPNSKYRDPSPVFQGITADSTFPEATPKFQLSPRLNVAYPITDRQKLSISYGIFFKMPELQYLYDGYNIQLLRGNQLIGNPQLDAQRTNQYEVSYENQFTDDFAFSLTSYYKDIYNQLGLVFVRAVPNPYPFYVVSEYGNAKGLEFEIRKRPTDNIGLKLNYTLSSVKGTSSNASENYLLTTDPYSGKFTFPLTDYPLNYDRMHRVNLILDFFWGDADGPSIGGIKFLENSNINLSGFWQTGTPYTRTDVNNRPLSEKNAERQPSVWQIDLRLSKKFYLRDLFGESAGQAAIELFADIINLINYNEAVAVYGTTGDPDDDGISLQRQIGSFSSVEYYKEGNFAFPQTISVTQYDAFGNRLYNAAADFDHNGIVSREERFKSYQNWVKDALSFRGNYRFPRQVYVGIMFSF